ncbi:MAG TPA: BON domain-containing protein [Burkholderiales bacterium]
MSPLLLGITLGAAGAMLLDPEQGRRRRALLRDKVTRTMKEGREFADAASKDIQNRAQGIRAHVEGMRGGPVSDETLVQRVRAKLGRYCSHPGAVQVRCDQARISLSGDILASEVEPILEALRAVRGVQQVDNQMNAYPSAEGISSLQGGTGPDRERLALLQGDWTPGIRVIGGGAGALLLAYALARGGVTGIAALAIGAALVGRASTNKPLGTLVQRKITQPA